jgi:hypothetical protein
MYLLIRMRIGVDPGTMIARGRATMRVYDYQAVFFHCKELFFSGKTT